MDGSNSKRSTKLALESDTKSNAHAVNVEKSVNIDIDIDDKNSKESKIRKQIELS